MAPIDPLRLTSRDKTDRAAQAATFELVGRAAHNLILHVILESVKRSQETMPLSRVVTAAIIPNYRVQRRLFSSTTQCRLQVGNAGAESQTDFGSADPSRPRTGGFQLFAGMRPDGEVAPKAVIGSTGTELRFECQTRHSSAGRHPGANYARLRFQDGRRSVSECSRYSAAYLCWSRSSRSLAE